MQSSAALVTTVLSPHLLSDSTMELALASLEWLVVMQSRFIKYLQSARHILQNV